MCYWKSGTFKVRSSQDDWVKLIRTPREVCFMKIITAIWTEGRPLMDALGNRCKPERNSAHGIKRLRVTQSVFVRETNKWQSSHERNKETNMRQIKH